MTPVSVQPIGAGDVNPWITFPMNPGHRRRLASTYQHMDDLLRKAEAILAGDESHAPFGQVILDTEPWQRATLQEQAARVRSLLKATLDRFGIEMPVPCIPASRSAYILLMGVEIDLQELGGRRLEAYGPMPLEEARGLAAAHEETLGVLKEMRAFLVQTLGSGDPEGRPAPPAPAPGEHLQDGRDA